MSDYPAPPPPPEDQPPGEAYAAGSMPEYSSAQPPAAVSRPASIATAVKLMYVGAGLSLVGVLTTALQQSTIRAAVEKASRSSSTPLTTTQIDAAVTVAVAAAVIIGLVGAALWLWMAAANGKGRSWARIVATVFYGLSVLSTLSSLAQHAPALSLTVSLITLVLGGYIIYLLFRPESSRYYAAQSAPRI